MNAAVLPPPPPSVSSPPAPPDKSVALLKQMEQTVSGCLIERDEEVKAMLRCLVANEHMLLVGPPGTAKSLLCSLLAKTIAGAQIFEVLLTKFSTPEDLYGPISVTGLKNDKYVRMINGYMPNAHISFVDEVWKASPAILNTMLTIMQERRFDNGGIRVDCPLRMMIAASNEWPQGDELGAAFDRFLVRRIVKPVSRSRQHELLFSDLKTAQPIASLQDIDSAHAKALSIPFSEAAKDAVEQILSELADNGIVVGDRRKRKSMRLAQADAFLSSNSEVQPENLEPLVDVMWEDPIEHPAKAKEIIMPIVNPKQAEVNRLFTEVESVEKLIKANPHDANTRAAGAKKLQEISNSAAAIGSERAAKLSVYARKQWQILCARNLQVSDRMSSLVGK